MEIKNEQEHQNKKDIIYLAWHMAAFNSSTKSEKGLEDLSKIHERMDYYNKPEEDRVDQQINELQRITKMFGGKINIKKG